MNVVAQIPAPPPRFTDPEVTARLRTALASGTSWTAAARHARIARSTLYLWRDRGEAAAALEDAGLPVPAEEQIYLDWWREMLQAMSDAAVRVVGLVHRHAETDPPTARWLAERLDREQYRLEQKVEVTGQAGGPIQTQNTHVVVQLDTTDQAKADAFLGALADAGVLEVPSVEGD